MQDKTDTSSNRRPAPKLQSTGSAFTLVRQSKAAIDLIGKQTEAQVKSRVFLRVKFYNCYERFLFVLKS